MGELAFLNYKFGEEESDDKTLPLASADAIIEENEILVWEWDFTELKSFLEGEREVSNALSAYINHDLRQKIIRTGVSLSD